eukprot:s1204_g14.t1
MLDEFYDTKGLSAIAIEVEDTMTLASYCPPSDSDLEEHASLLEEMLIRIAWQGKMLWCADWNQEPEEAWAVSLAAMFDAETVPISATSTRWKGKRVIDFFISNIPNLHSHVLGSQISDHKIVETSLEIAHGNFTDWRVKKDVKLDRPSWLTYQAWNNLLSEALEIEQSTGWQRACKEMDIEDTETD